MRQYKWVKGVLAISNIVYGIKAAVWIVVSAIYILRGIMEMSSYGMGDSAFYLLLAGIQIFLVSGAIPALASMSYSIVICRTSKKWLKNNLKKCKVNFFVDSCIKTVLFLIDCVMFWDITMSSIESGFSTNTWMENVEVIIFVIYAVLLLLNFINLFLIGKIAHK